MSATFWENVSGTDKFLPYATRVADELPLMALEITHSIGRLERGIQGVAE